jgi:integrase
VLKLVKECVSVSAENITPESFQTWRSSGSRSVKTLNEYLTSMRTLLNWMVKRTRITVNPLNCVEILPMNGDQVRPRRDFSDDEMRRVLAVAGERRVAYLVAAFTGLRGSDLAGIRFADLVLEGDVVRVIVCKHY